MSKVATLKKQAAELEQKKQFDKALAVYVKLLDAFDEYADELDVALFNRVGDLMLRQGNVADAVDYYEKAVDRYADTGFFNNAIALCNKILRQSPGRASVYYKLGKISAQKGFKAEAKTNFLEYADRMQKSGKVDEAFRALKEFADLCPDQDEIRLMLADQLTKADRKSEGVEQLQILYARYQTEGRAVEAEGVADRIRTIDPSVELKADGGSAAKSSSSDLIFLDLDAPSPRSASTPAQSTPMPVRPAPPIPAPPASPTPVSATPVSTTPVSTTPLSNTPIPSTPRSFTPINEPAVSDSATSDMLADDAAASDTPVSGDALSGISRIGEDAVVIQETPTSQLLGLESTALSDSDIIKSTPSSAMLDLEPTSLIEEPPEPIHRSSMPTHVVRDEPAESTDGPDLEFIMPDVDEPEPRAKPSIDFDTTALTTPPVTQPPPAMPTPRTVHAALDGLPLMDLDVPSVANPPAPAPPRASKSLEEITLSDDLGLIDEPLDEAIDEPIGGPLDEPFDEPLDEPLTATFGELVLDEAPEEGLDETPEQIDLNAESLTIDDDEPVSMPTPSIARRSTMVAMASVDILKASVEGEPENWSLRRELAEAMLEAGDREGGIRELEAAMAGAEHGGDLDLASSLAEEIARLEPEAVRHHQKRVEYAFRTNDRPRLVEAYLALGDALLRSDQADKARAIYQRVIDIAPDEIRAQAALDAMPAPEPEPAPPPPPARGSAGGRKTTAMKAPVQTAPAAAADDFINLGDWLRDDEAPKDTRMIVAEQEPSGDEQADFADMLRKFKQGVAENVDAEDYQSHYDLAIAFKEMGLLDEAIAEFQKALGSPTNRLPTYEALGQCFLEKGQWKLASSILSRALNEKANEDQLVGVLYLLGRAAEEQGHASEALGYYQRVFMLDIQFRDIADRMNEVERAAQ